MSFRIGTVRSALRLLSAAAMVFTIGAVRPAAAAEDPLTTVKVEFFGAEKGYAAGSGHVTLLCVLRNTGKEPLPASTLRVRCYALSGLDYTDGELTPLVPALSPGQAAAFRWHLAPTDRSNALVATALLMRAVTPARLAAQNPVVVNPNPAETDPALDQPAPVPHAFLSVIPHISSPAAATAPPSGFAGPASVYTSTHAKIGNDRVSLRLQLAAGRAPVGFLAGKAGTAWQTAGVVFPLFSILAAGDGQKPWQRAFKWSTTDSHTDADASQLVLTGNCGDDWEAQITLETRKDTGAINGRLRLKARRTSRLFAVQLPRITAPTDSAKPAPPADGNGIVLTVDPDAADASAMEGAAAVHRGMLTSGISWTPRSPVTDWLATKLPAGDTEHAVQLGVGWGASADSRGEVFLPGGLVEFAFRLFCASPSLTVRDAERFILTTAP